MSEKYGHYSALFLFLCIILYYFNIFIVFLFCILCFAKSYIVKKWLLNTMHYIGIVHPKMKILSSFTHPPFVPNLRVAVFC